MNRHCIPGLTMSNSPDGETSGGVSGILKRCTQGLARTRIALCQRPGNMTRKKPDVKDLARKDFV